MDVRALQKIKKDYDLDLTIPFGKSLIIDTTKLKPMAVARTIKKHYKL